MAIGSYSHKDLRKACDMLADKFGAETVIALCDSIGHGSWWVCDECNNESPHCEDPEGDNSCLICGHGTRLVIA
jgi:rubrerythrin